MKIIEDGEFVQVPMMMMDKGVPTAIDTRPIYVQSIVMDAGAQMKVTADGYLAAHPRVARTGIQLYLGSEVRRPDLSVVRVYRPPDEVFQQDSMRSYAHRPVTNDHPPVHVEADNWKEYATGQSGERVQRDGDYIRVPIVVMDKTAVADVMAGKRELSLGYSMDLEWTSGKLETGEEYDAIMRNIRGNHLAVVTAARGGQLLRIGDEQQEEQDMSVADSNAPRGPALRSIIVDGISIDTTDVGAQIVTRTIDALTKLRDSLQASVAELTTKLTATTTDHAAALKNLGDTKDAEIATLKKQLGDAAITPAKLDVMVGDRVKVVTKARSILKDKLVVDGKSDNDIRRQVVDAAMGDAAKGWSDDMVTASFNTIKAGEQNDTNTGGNGGSGNLTRDGLLNQQPVGDAVEKAYDEYEKNLTEAWRGPQVKAA